MVNKVKSKMKNYTLFLFFTILIGCSQDVDCLISATIIDENGMKITSVELGQHLEVSPINFKSFPITEMTVDSTGKFQYRFKFKVKSSNLFADYHLYIRKEGFFDLNFTVNLIENNRIDLDTIILRRKVIKTLPNKK